MQQTCGYLRLATIFRDVSFIGAYRYLKSDLNLTRAKSKPRALYRRRALVLLPGISSPVRGGLPPRRFMSLSKALKSARALRSAKNSAVCKAESFSATAEATN
jgi:hypothetical protein